MNFGYRGFIGWFIALVGLWDSCHVLVVFTVANELKYVYSSLEQLGFPGFLA